MLAFAVVLIVVLRRRMPFSWAACFTPVAVIGTYYAAADPFHMTQLEALVGMPIFIALWAAADITPVGRTLALRYFVSGLAAGATVCFKLIFAPIFVAFWLVAMGYALRAHGAQAWRAIMLTMAAPVTLGVLAVLGAVAVLFYSDGNLRELYWTAFVYPGLAFDTAPTATNSRLAHSLLFVGSYFVAWSAFIVVALVDWWTGRRDLFRALLLTWLLVGLVVILVQTFSWWPYHFLILFTPAGILGVWGCTVIPARLMGRQDMSLAQAALVTFLLLFAATATLGVPLAQKLKANVEVFVAKQGEAADFKEFVNRDYAAIKRSVRFLNTESARPGPIYVFGDPLYYLLSGRDPAFPIIGWPWQYFLDQQWVHLPRQIETAKPPYIYVDRENKKLIEARGGGVEDVINARYVPLTSDHKGKWYQIKRSALASP